MMDIVTVLMTALVLALMARKGKGKKVSAPVVEIETVEEVEEEPVKKKRERKGGFIVGPYYQIDHLRFKTTVEVENYCNADEERADRSYHIDRISKRVDTVEGAFLFGIEFAKGTQGFITDKVYKLFMVKSGRWVWGGKNGGRTLACNHCGNDLSETPKGSFKSYDRQRYCNDTCLARFIVDSIGGKLTEGGIGGKLTVGETYYLPEM